MKHYFFDHFLPLQRFMFNVRQLWVKICSQSQATFIKLLQHVFNDFCKTINSREFTEGMKTQKVPLPISNVKLRWPSAICL